MSEPKTLTQIAKESGISAGTVYSRKRKGQPLEGPLRRAPRGSVPCKHCGELGHRMAKCEKWTAEKLAAQKARNLKKEAVEKARLSKKEEADEMRRLAEKHGVRVQTIRYRIKNGQPLEGAPRVHPITLSCNECGRTGHIAKTCELRKVANYVGLSVPTLRKRMTSGLPLEGKVQRIVTCTECGQSGHLAATCELRQIALRSGVQAQTIRARKADGQPLEGPSREHTVKPHCATCGKPGHHASTCGKLIGVSFLCARCGERGHRVEACDRVTEIRRLAEEAAMGTWPEVFHRMFVLACRSRMNPAKFAAAVKEANETTTEALERLSKKKAKIAL